MPLYNFSQLVGKTFVMKVPTPFYRLNDIATLGDKSKPVGNLKVGYSFVLDSYLAPREAGGLPPYPCPPLCYAKRSNYYFTFKGNDGKNYGVIYDPVKKQFDTGALKQQGAKTVEEEIKEAEEAAKDPIAEFFKGTGKTVKNLLYIGAGVLAIGYLLPKFLKK